jgi:hypothetical protein
MCATSQTAFREQIAEADGFFALSDPGMNARLAVGNDNDDVAHRARDRYYFNPSSL